MIALHKKIKENCFILSSNLKSEIPKIFIIRLNILSALEDPTMLPFQ